jgi:uncharacterized protein (DUF934 family)
MLLVKTGCVVEDSFVRVLDDALLPDHMPVLVPAARLLADSTELIARGSPVGVLWPNNRKISELVPHLDRLALIALMFPSFRDGRAYSQARQLRETYGFRREVRATGDVLRDQFLFLLRAGFDAFEVKKETDAAAFTAAVAHYSVYYQPTGKTFSSALQERLAHQTIGFETSQLFTR